MENAKDPRETSDEWDRDSRSLQGASLRHLRAMVRTIWTPGMLNDELKRRRIFSANV